MPVPAVTAAGSFTVSSGSMTATQDAMFGVPPTLNLIFRFGSVITAQSVTSLPVPAVVGTAISGGVRLLVGVGAPPYSVILPPGGGTTPQPLGGLHQRPPPPPPRAPPPPARR